MVCVCEFLAIIRYAKPNEIGSFSEEVCVLVAINRVHGGFLMSYGGHGMISWAGKLDLCAEIIR